MENVNGVSELKEELKSLYEKKRLLEEKVNECLDRLQSSGIGLEGSLIDSEGFPRNDLDIMSVRSDRIKVKELSNDHKALMNEIEAKLHKLHAQSRGEGDFVAPPQHTHEQVGAQAMAAPLAVPSASTAPFAVIDEISENSPAMTAGLMLGDEIIQCGHITAQTPNSLETMGALVMEHEDQEVNLFIRRHDETMKLTLHPKKWDGRGLLGCHLSKIKS